VRLDANNLWQDWRVAADYLQRLSGAFAGIEEPLAAGDRTGMADLFHETGIPVILDESLLRAAQFAGLAEGIGWRINLRVSKLGGLLRLLDVLEAARDRGIPVIVGAQVGETILLTRAALTRATEAGHLQAVQEGAFGTHLPRPADLQAGADVWARRQAGRGAPRHARLPAGSCMRYR
jgi:L-alanine-DL-glutamate epimerase-like enolase superfamily enzyme